MQTQNKTIETIFFMAIAIEQSEDNSDLIGNLKWAIEQEFEKWPIKELLYAIDGYLAQKKCPYGKKMLCKYLPETTYVNLEDVIDLSMKDTEVEALAAISCAMITYRQT